MAICGKFRGTVVDNIDPLGIGRVKVRVPDVQGGIEAFAMPCLPYAGQDVGFFACPPIGANVWVEFEGGDVSLPIWTGCFWGEGEAPFETRTPEKKSFLVPGARLILDDTPGSGGIALELTGADVLLRLDGNRLVLQHKGGSIEIEGIKVSINHGSLEVT